MAKRQEQRRHAITDLIRTRAAGSQDELAEQLGRLGFTVTQATISRDLEQLGAVKTRRDGRLSYSLPSGAGGGSSRLAAVLREWVLSVVTAGNLVVIRTPPGSAHLVGVALDDAGLPDIAGTICGDDTVFAATAGAQPALAIAAQLDAMRMGEASL
jgi:transcriptional regulator of arginine metabolism